MASNVNPMDELITKSLDEIDELVKGLSVEEEEEESLAKGMGDNDDDDMSPDDVSDEADDDQDNDDDQDEDDQDDNPDEDEDAEKSLADELNSNENVRKALEVSDFLDSLVQSLDNVLTRHSASVNKSVATSEHTNDLLTKSVQGILKSQKSVVETQARVMQSQSKLAKSLDKLGKRLEKIEHQPSTRKSVSANKATAIQKSFDASIGATPEAGQQRRSNADISKSLFYEFQNGHSELQSDILAFESTGDINSLSDNAKSLLKL